MKVKTNVAALIQRLQAYKARERENYAKAAELYPERAELYRAKVIAGLERELARVKRGGKLPDSYGYTSYNGRGAIQGVIVHVGAMPPSKPQRPSFGSVDRRIAELRLCSTEDIVIDPSSRDWLGMIQATDA